MPFQTSWLFENKVILTEFTSDIVLEDLVENDKHLLALVEAGNPPVHIICVASDVASFPKQITQINHSAEPYLRHDAMGWFMLVGLNNRLIRFVGSTVAQITKIKMKHMNSVEEAIDVLRRIDPEVRDMNLTL